MTIETFTAALPHGITLACRACGPDHGPRAILLHGFPEAAFAWDAVMGALSTEVRCVAPNLRGFDDSSAPSGAEAYKPRYLMQDIEALILQGGGPVDLLVAHDWGGAVAWNLAAARPDLIKRLLIINSPHPATFLRELRDNSAQQVASAYMNFLCRPDAETLLAENDFARLWPFFERMGGGAWLTESHRAQYRVVWSKGLTGGLNYYRASPLRPPMPGDQQAVQALRALQLPDSLTTSRVPTSVLWGEADHALLPGLLDGLERWVSDLRLTRIPQASHWIVHEQPQTVVAEIRRCLSLG